jgi:UDP-2,3-diacylglucosamine pyrophosphatase LpxH
MLPAEEIVVVSDLHLAAERGRGLFQADEQLAEFLGWVLNNLNSCHVILNGDVFDFLVGKREDTAINLDDAATEAASILINHQEVFEVLSLIANSEAHELIILGGNHDPETALPTVQEQIGRSLKPSDSHTPKPVCSHFPIRWLTNGEGALLQVGEAKVLIEHGDQYDAWNWIDHEALRRVICLASRNVPYQDTYRKKSPPGSRLVVNRFNHIRDQFPWLQTLQPLSASILPLALEVILPQVSRTERTKLIKAAREFRDFGLRSLTDTAVRKISPSKEYWANGDDERQMLSEWLAQYEREEKVWGVVDDTKAWLRRAAARLSNLTAKRLLKKVAQRDAFYDISANDGSYDAVERLVSKGTNLIVHGHTHSAKAYPVGPGLYLNTGTWGQLTELPDAHAGEEEWAVYIEELKAGRAPSRRRPTFAHISRQKEGTVAALLEWRSGAPPEQLSAWRFVNNQWRKEQ